MKKLSIVILVVMAVTALSQQHEQPYTLSVDVNVVLLNVRVSEHGRTVTGLRAGNFQVLEDRHPQEIAFFSGLDAPATVGLIVDSSASMAPKWHDLQAAVGLFADQSNPQDEMFLINFNQDLHWPLAPGKAFTSDMAELRNAMMGVHPVGKTALYDAISAGLVQTKDGRFDKRILVVLSDGSDNASSVPEKDVLVALQRANVTVFSIGLYDPQAWDRNPGVLKRVASITGGEAFFPRNREELQDAWSRISSGIRNEYTLGYYPRNVPDGSYHQLAVQVVDSSVGRVSVRTRPGYFAPAKQTHTSR